MIHIDLNMFSTGPIGYSDTGQGDDPGTVTVFQARKGSFYTENHQIECQSLTVTLFYFQL